MSVTMYGYVPAWGLPCISPYVTKTANYMSMAGIDYELKAQDLAVLDDDAPTGKLPYIVDEDGTKVHDSTRIIEHLQRTRGNPFDADESASDAAVARAFQRLVEENLYWSGIIQPRWRMDVGWHTYVPYILAQPEKSYEELWPTLDEGLQGFLDSFRQRILDGFMGQGMGRRTDEEVLEFYRDDVNALSEFMGSEDFFMGTGRTPWTRPCIRYCGTSWTSPTPGRGRTTLTRRRTSSATSNGCATTTPFE